MQQIPLQLPGSAGEANTSSSYTFKEIERFSQELCQELASKHGDQYLKTDVIYGLTAFQIAVHHAVSATRRHPQKSSGQT